VLSAEDLTRLEAEVVASIESLVFPAYAKLRSFLESEYLPEARKEAGIWAWPEGEKTYNLTIHFFTSLPLTGTPPFTLAHGPKHLLTFHTHAHTHTHTAY
jgi:uncharacterized protein (DUF885 family)